MKRIKSDISNNTFSHIYLLYGSEDILKRQYRDKLVRAMLPDANEMNLNYFTGEDVTLEEIISISETMPFFSERRLICINDSGFFKSSSAFAEYVERAPEYTYYIFTEKECDKRNALYKYVVSAGYACEITLPAKNELMTMAAVFLKTRGLLISQYDCEYLIDKVGTDMARLQSELEKLAAYCMGEESVNRQAIDEICSEIPEGRIFAMMDALMASDSDRAFGLYCDLLAAHEKPMNILFMLNRSYDQLYRCSLLFDEGKASAQISKETGLKDFQTEKYLRLARKKKRAEIHGILRQGIELEKKVKSGDLDEKIAVEIFLVKNLGL